MSKMHQEICLPRSRDFWICNVNHSISPLQTYADLNSSYTLSCPGSED